MNAPLLLTVLLRFLMPAWAAPQVGGRAPVKPVGSSSSIRRIAVLGERHSGTNFMALLLATNLDPRVYVYGDHFCQNRCGAQSGRVACMALSSELHGRMHGAEQQRSHNAVTLEVKQVIQKRHLPVGRVGT